MRICVIQHGNCSTWESGPGGSLWGRGEICVYGAGVGLKVKPSELLPKIKADIDAFVGDAPQFDDITMLCLEYKAKMEESK